VDRRITGYNQDDEGNWVAELECGHQQHVTSQPVVGESAMGHTRAGADSRARRRARLQEMRLSRS
jgi:hypothetical protein